MIITIDGPTASGKSTIGRLIAQHFGYYYIYSGLLYRALAYDLKNRYGYTSETINKPDPVQIAESIARMQYTYSSSQNEQILFDTIDITPFLKDHDIDQLASLVSMNQSVREAINEWQHMIADDHDLVVDGRDAGTIVFPDADYKFYLTARPQIRAERWRSQQKKRGNVIDFDQALDFIMIRDERDSNREHAPMQVAKNGIVIDNSDLDVKETIQKIIHCMSI